MKRMLYILSFLFSALFFLFGCGGGSCPSVLVVADSLISVAPDSALRYLEGLNDKMASASESVRMYYHLLCVKAADRSFVPHTSDSLILPVLRYYEKNNRRYLPEAYYYAGRVYLDLHDASRSLDCFGKSLKELPGEGNELLEICIYNQLGTLFSIQGLHKEALDIYRTCHRLSIASADSVEIINSLYNMGHTYRELDRQDSAQLYLEEAEPLACCRSECRDLHYAILGDLICIYLNLQNGKAMPTFNKRALHFVNRFHSANFSTGAAFYLHTSYEDADRRAKEFYDKLPELCFVEDRQVAYRELLLQAAIAPEKIGCMEPELPYIRHFVDSVHKITRAASLRQMNSLYDYQLQKKDNLWLEASNREKTLYISVSLVAIVIILLLFLVYRLYSKRKRVELLFRLQMIEQIKDDAYKRSNRFIEESNAKIHRLEEELQERCATNENLKQELQRQKELLAKETRQMAIEQEKRTLAQQIVSESELCRTFRERLLDPKGVVYVTADEWKSLKEKLGSVYPDFFPKLSSLYAFNDFQWQVCMLVKAQFAPAEIAKLTERPKETITSTRRRLYNRIFQEKGVPEDWDNFIHSL